MSKRSRRPHADTAYLMQRSFNPGKLLDELSRESDAKSRRQRQRSYPPDSDHDQADIYRHGDTCAPVDSRRNGLDYYPGRVALNTKYIIDKLSKDFPEATLLDYKGSIVAPLLVRHSLHGVPYEQTTQKMATLKRQHPVMTNNRTLEGPRAIRYHRAGGSVLAIAMNAGPNVLVEETTAAARTFSTNPYKPEFQGHFMIRVAEFSKSMDSRLAVESLAEELQKNTGLVLDSVQLCDTPEKQHAKS